LDDGCAYCAEEASDQVELREEEGLAMEPIDQADMEAVAAVTALGFVEEDGREEAISARRISACELRIALTVESTG
jgi:hypothetical protein